MSTHPPAATVPLPARRIRFAWLLGILAVAVGIVLLVTSLIISKKVPKNETAVSSFCCPDEAKAMLPAINLSSNPCDSFYDYVCVSTIKYGLWPSWNARSSFEKDIATATNLQNNSAAIFLSNLFLTCVGTIWRKKTLVEQLADTIAGMGHMKRSMTRDEVLLYLLETSLRLGFSSVVHIQREEENALSIELRLVHESSSQFHYEYKISVKAAVNVFNTKFGTSISVDQVSEFAALVNEKLENIEYVDEDEIASWLTLEELKGALVKTGWASLQNITNLRVDGAAEIELVLDLIFQVAHHQVGLVYVLAHSILSPLITLSFRLEGRRPERPAFDRCFVVINKLLNLKDQMYTGILTSPAKEHHMQDLYRSVVDSLETDIKQTRSFEQQEVDHFLRRLHELSFVVPSQRLLDLANPLPTTVFAKDFCEGMLYEYLANELREQSPYIGFVDQDSPLTYVGGKYVLISPAFFKFLSFNTTHKDFLNLPPIGVQMAAVLWQILLRNTPHSKETKEKIDTFFKCFRDVYLPHRVMSPLEYYIVSRALGIHTVLGVLKHSKWHDIKTAWSLLKMSTSQLFYLREMFYRCPYTTSKRNEESFNAPLRYTRDFGESFHCDSNSLMASKPAVCVL